jgi:hypothetical protein
MTLTTRITLIGLAAAALLAWSLGGARGAGTIAGYLAGASITGFALARQRHVLRSAPERALQTVVEGFLLKLAAIVLAALVLATVPAVRERIDLVSFFLAFAVAALLILFPGTASNARILRGRAQ